MLDVIIVNYNTKHLLDEFFRALDDASKDLVLRYLLVDNASRDGSDEWLKGKSGLAALQLNSINIGFGRANNQLVPEVESPYILLLNTDAFVEKDSLKKAIEFMGQNPQCGVMGARLVGRNGALQPSCRAFPTPLNLFIVRCGLRSLFPSVPLVDDPSCDHDSVRSCDWVPGCFYLMRREVLDQVGLFDPLFFLYYEEVDHCKRVKESGWHVMYNPEISVVHVGGESAKSDGRLSKSGRQLTALQAESEFIYMRKHHGLLGLLSHVMLLLLGDLLLAAKDVVKRFRFTGIVEGARSASLALKTVVRTKLGTQATR